jgi:hypothetical protein
MLLAGGVAFGGARAGSSATTRELREFKNDFKDHCDADARMNVRVARVETLMEAVHGRVVLKRRRVDNETGENEGDDV